MAKLGLRPGLTPASALPGVTRFAPPRGPRIGLLGGSFNPAHAGHRHISLKALHQLKLDGVWWLVSPQNPFKGVPAPYAKRMAQARAVAHHPRIQVSDFEKRAGTRYTVDTLRALKQRYPGHQFVWLMGADNLAQFHTWRAADDIAALVPFAVIDRPGQARRSLTARTARTLAARRYPAEKAALLADSPAPAWVFLGGPLSHLSSTALRAAAQHVGAA